MTIAKGSSQRDSPYQMWIEGTLDDYLHIPHDGTRVEIIDGEVAVSAALRPHHAFVIRDISLEFASARRNCPSFPWRHLQNVGLNFIAAEDAYIPDLIVMDADAADAARDPRLLHLVTEQVEMVIEVASPSNASRNRRSPASGPRKGKWSGYARAEIPYYLLVDLDPAVATSLLYSIPDQSTGAYLHEETWPLGDTIRLPEPFALEIPTTPWQPWFDD